MENVFENAYFGKAYLTRDGRKALYQKDDKLGGLYHHWLVTEKDYFACTNTGKQNVKTGQSPLDVVSEWKDGQLDSEKMLLTGIVKRLWDIIDDIDSFADNCINDTSEDNPFRVILRKCGKRHEMVNTDGYNLFLNGEKI